VRLGSPKPTHVIIEALNEGNTKESFKRRRLTWPFLGSGELKFAVN
jgi:hypothetical protein